MPARRRDAALGTGYNPDYTMPPSLTALPTTRVDAVWTLDGSLTHAGRGDGAARRPTTTGSWCSRLPT